MGVINQAKDLIKSVTKIEDQLYVCNDILEKLDLGRNISIGDRYLKEHGYLYAEVSAAIKSIAVKHLEKLACELDELDKQDITCGPVKEGW